MSQVDTSRLRNQLAQLAEQSSGNGNGQTQALAKPTKDQFVRQLIERMRPEIEQAVPAHVDPNRLTRILLTAVRTNPDLQRAAVENEKSRHSLLAAIMLTAQLGLEPGPLGQAYLVPFRNTKENYTECQLIIGYRGLLELARRSGQIQSVMVEPVCEGDEFEYELGLNPKLYHKPALKNRGKPYLYYGIVRFKDGGYQMAVMSLEDIERHRQRSRAKDSGPWKDFYDEMCRKTVLRAMWRWLPVSVEYQAAVAMDEAVARGVPERGMVNVTPGYAPPESDETVTIDAEAVAVDEPEPQAQPKGQGQAEGLL